MLYPSFTLKPGRNRLSSVSQLTMHEVGTTIRCGPHTPLARKKQKAKTRQKQSKSKTKMKSNESKAQAKQKQKQSKSKAEEKSTQKPTKAKPVSYTHLTLPTICSV